MRRLNLSSVIAGFVLLAGAVAVAAQEPAKPRRIGFVSPSSPETYSIEAFRQGLREAGRVEGKDVIIETRFAEGHPERLPRLVAELVELKVEVLVAGSTPGALAAKRAAKGVPVVFAGVWDPVGSGIVTSLPRPGGRITGVAVGVGGPGFTGKCLEILKEAVPGLPSVAVLVNPSYPLSEQVRREAGAAAGQLKLALRWYEAQNPRQLEDALTAIGASDARAIFVAPDPFLTDSSRAIADFALAKRLPALHFSQRFSEAGGLLSYGGSLADTYRRAAVHVDKILRGANPGDLAVEQPTRFELVINLATARTIGLDVPARLLQQAHHTIK